MIKTEKQNLKEEDIIYMSYLNLKLKKSIEDIKKGRVMSIKESKERLRKKYEDCSI